MLLLIIVIVGRDSGSSLLRREFSPVTTYRASILNWTLSAPGIVILTMVPALVKYRCSAIDTYRIWYSRLVIDRI